ncbi:RISC-loading complex subunit tarbp2 [Hyalella azteca]|uniref:RISC-loading complex subunit tarbp2 n=1 Tax=Hyalella azteca TaxID=294128 RepID=A0A8B7NPQ3_HYAAZ|nr:RISC-loading complex subunit tarbp2 [Hyalella azteca]
MYHSTEQASVDTLAASLPCKTPVSLLQELCMRRGISPKYDLLQIEGAVHEPTFVYRVTVGEFIANGSGQSKKKAKHAAAKAVLDIIIHGGSPPAATSSSQLNSADSTIPSAVSAGSSNHADLSNLVVSPYDDGIPGNPVGQLQELCMTRRWPPPTYELIAEEGFPHERTFSIACTIATYKEIGGGKSKKLAKRQAAFCMLQKLQDMPQDYQNNSALNDDDDDLAQKLALRYSNLKDTKVKSLTNADSRKVSQFHKSLKQKGGQNLKDLQVTSLSMSGVDFVQMLQNISEEVGLVVTYVGVEERSFSGEYQCLLQLSTLPVVVCFGTGATPEDAESSAAHNALEYLKIMTKSRD